MWDKDLAMLAQNYAEGCIFAHSSSAERKTKTFSVVGENLAASTSKSKDYVNLVQSWYNEVADYNYNDNSCAPGRACGHYTQVGSYSNREQ